MPLAEAPWAVDEEEPHPAVRLFTETWVPGWGIQSLVTLFLSGVQLVFIGVLGEYLGRIYGEVKRRPLYLVKERLGFASARLPDGDSLE